MRKHCNRKPIVALPPRGMRPMLDAGQRRDLGLVHMVNLDTISRGEADEATLWQVVGGVLTWSCVANRLKRGQVEMDAQLAMTTRLVEHYRDTGVIEFVAGDYELAKTGTVVMDLLAELVDRPTAIAAAESSEKRIERMSEGCHV
jgi:hypothetical protein